MSFRISAILKRIRGLESTPPGSTTSAVLVNGASSNTITVRFAAETTGTITAKAGSVLRYRLLN